MSGETTRTWKHIILTNLQQRNFRECRPFDDLVTFTTRMYDNVDQLRNENIDLTVQNKQLQQENLDLQVQYETSSSKLSERTPAVEKKLFLLQEEVADLHRRKSEHAQRIIDLKNEVEDKDRKLHSATLRLEETEVLLSSVRSTCKTLEHKLQELELANETLRDEHEALQLAYTSLEEKYRKLEREHQDLITRWIALKARDADRLNAENEKFTRIRQAQVQKELEEAAKDTPSLNHEEAQEANDFVRYLKCPVEISCPPCVVISLPTKVLCKFDAHDGEVNAVQWSHSGSILASGGGDRKVKLWEIVHGQQVLKGTLTGSNAGVMAVEFDPQETVVVGASNDFASRVWTVADLRLRHTLTGHSGKVTAAKFLGELNRVVSGSHDRTLKIWDLRSRACVRTIFAGSSCNDVVTSSGNIISCHFDRRVRFWDTRSESSAKEYLLQGKITSLHLSADKNYLLCCVRDDSLKVLDMRMDKIIRMYCSDTFKVGFDWTRAQFSPDGQYVTAGGNDGNVYIWNFATAKLESVLKEHGCAIVACSWNPNGQYLISCDRNKKIVVWTESVA